MTLVENIRESLSAWLWMRALRRHQSRLGRKQAPAYTTYLRRCRRSSPYRGVVVPAIRRAADEFLDKGFSTFCTHATASIAQEVLAEIHRREAAGLQIWNADGEYAESDPYLAFPQLESLLREDVGAFLNAVFGTHFKIWYNKLYRSKYSTEPASGSQRWHGDGGPGTCIILMFALSDLTSDNGAMECLPWDVSLEIYEYERRERKRQSAASKGLPLETKKALFEDVIDRKFSSRIEQPVGPKGTVLAFRNNILHKGGYPSTNVMRYVWLVHAYPSDRPPPLDRYRKAGLAKRGSYPADPADDF